MDRNKLGTMMQSAAKVPISELNECITCKLCRGYFIDATTIIECLHTFCRSCIVHYLESNKYCPICDVQVHKTKPLLNLRPDKTIQDLVYKLVPRLYQNEIQRRKSFYETHPEGKPTSMEESVAVQYDYILAPEEVINLTLSYHGCCSTPRYLRCPSAVSVTHIKKLIRAKYELTDHHRVDVFYNQDCLNPSFSLMDISYIYSWKRKDPLDLTYKIYECRAKKPKLETTDKSENIVNNSTNINNNNWKEVQLRISENGEMSITGIEDSTMLDLLDATENFKSEIVINEGKNLDNFSKPVQVDTNIGNSEMKIQVNHNICIDSHLKVSENATGMIQQENLNENTQKPIENHVPPTSKKDIPGLKLIGKTSSSSCTTSTFTSTKASCVGTKIANSTNKMINNSLKTGNSIPKTVNSSIKANLEPRNCTETSSLANTPISTTTTKASSAKQHKTLVDHKLAKTSTSLIQVMPKSMELSASLNLNSELSVIPLNANTSCVSLSSSDVTTTVFSTINKSMCSTRMEDSGISQNSGTSEEKVQSSGADSKKCPKENEKESTPNCILKESKNLKRKSEDNGKTPEIPAKLPKPTILNHSIGFLNLSNNHPLKKHSKMNRNGEHLLRTPEVSEKIPISTPNLTVNHVSVSQKPISMASSPSKPIIINKNVSNMQINRPGTPKSGQRGGQAGNVPCYANKSMYNSVGSLNKMGEKNGERIEGMQGKTEVINSAVNSISKSTISHPIHHTQSYQTSLHTPIITPSQLPHHQNLNSLQLKSAANSNHIQEKADQKTSHSSVTTSQSNTMTCQVSIGTSQNNMTTSQSILISSQSTVSDLKALIASQCSTMTTQSNMATPHLHVAQKSSDSLRECSQSPNKQTSSHSIVPSQAVHDSIPSSVPSTIQNSPLHQTPPSSIAAPITTTIKTKPSTPIGYKTLRDPPKSWNSQINSQIARVNQNVKAQQLANAAAAAASQGGVNAQGRFIGDLKSVRPAKFFKGRNMPRYLGCPASGVKPMYQVQGSPDKDKTQDQAGVQTAKPEKSEIKKHSIVKIDPKTLRPISEKAPDTSNLSNISSNLGLNSGQNNQELRINSSQDLKINTSSVSIFNPLKLQSSPKSERKSPKSPHSPKVKSSPNSSNAPAIATSTTSTASSPSNTLSPKQHRDKNNLTFTPPNPFVPNLASPTLSPNQFLYPAGGFPSYDPRVMAAYHSLWYTQRMAAAAAAGFVPPPMPHAFSLNMGLNTAGTTMGQQHSPGISSKHLTPPKSSGQPSPRGTSTTPTHISKSSPTPPNKKTKDSTAKNEKSLETALNKLSQSKAKEFGANKQLGGSKKASGSRTLLSGNSMPVDAQRSGSPKVLGESKVSGGNDTLLRNPLHGMLPNESVGSKTLSGNKELGGSNFSSMDVQQGRASPKDSSRSNSTMSVLEKLSQNKAIEILGDVSGKRSPLVREGDGRNSPMGGIKPVLGSGRLTEGKDVASRGRSTPPVMEKPFTANETTKRQSPLTSSVNDTRNVLSKTNMEPDTSKNPQIQTKQSEKDIARKESDKTASATTTAPYEHKTVSPELQTRLGQCLETINDHINSDKCEKRLHEGQSGLRVNQNVATEEKQSDGSTHKSDTKKDKNDTSNVTSSDKIDKSQTDNDKKQVIVDSSDIKPSSSQNSGNTTKNTSAINGESSSGKCDNVVTDKPSIPVTDNATIENSLGSVVSSETTSAQTEGSVKSGDSAASEPPVVKDIVSKSAGDESSKGVNIPGDVMESDKGGGEKK